MKKQLVFNRPVWIFLLFLVGSFLFINLNFRYWFHFMEQFMMFQTTSVYWKELAAQLGGWNEYIAEYLTQAFSFTSGPAFLVTALSGLIALLFYRYQQACCGKASMGISILPLFLFWLFPSETIVPMLVLLWALAGTVSASPYQTGKSGGVSVCCLFHCCIMWRCRLHFCMLSCCCCTSGCGQIKVSLICIAVFCWDGLLCYRWW